MPFIQSNNLLGGAGLSGLSGSSYVYGNAVFSIGWDYLFASTSTNQTTGNLVQVEHGTGRPIVVLSTSLSIVTNPPYSNSWNNGNCMHSTTVDGTHYLYIRYMSNPTVVYRARWNENTRTFDNFVVFTTFTISPGGANYCAMCRMNDTTMKLITDSQMMVAEFDVRTGRVITQPTAVGGSWSPSSYPFCNTFATLDGYIVGASGNGDNWYIQTRLQPPTSETPTDAAGVVQSITTAGGGSSYQVFPSHHYNVSYYYPGTNGYIYAYQNQGSYIVPRGRRNSATPISTLSSPIQVGFR